MAKEKNMIIKEIKYLKGNKKIEKKMEMEKLLIKIKR
jgi:hypothetical protein